MTREGPRQAQMAREAMGSMPSTLSTFMGPHATAHLVLDPLIAHRPATAFTPLQHEPASVPPRRRTALALYSKREEHGKAREESMGVVFDVTRWPKYRPADGLPVLVVLPTRPCRLPPAGRARELFALSYAVLLAGCGRSTREARREKKIC